jgi:uncharacterized protein involved in exopolysaccharide biosynthesis/Mrp family chromosome partitioning ATPase
MSFIVKHDGRAPALAVPAHAPALPLPASVAAAGESLTIDFRALVRSLMRRKLWILVPMVLTTLAGLAFALMSEAKFTSVVQILVDPREIQVIRSDTPLRQNAPETGQTMAENALVILRSRLVLMTLVEKEKLHEDAEFIGKGSAKEGTADTLEGRQLRALRTLERRIGTKRADRSSVIEASIWTGNADKSARLANALATIFIDKQQGAESDTARKAANSVASKLDELGQQVQKAERDVEDYKTRHALQSANGKLVGEQQLQELNSQLVLARARASEARSKYDNVRKLSLQAIERGELPDANNSSVISQLRLKFAEASRLEADARSRLGAKHPEMASIAAQLRDARQLIQEELTRISRSAQGDYERARAAEEALTRSLDQLRDQYSTSGDAMVRLRELERQADASRTIYNAFLKRTRELTEQEDIATINARIVSPATPAQFANGPGKSIVVVGSLVVGSILGLLLAILAEQLDPNLRTRKQFQQATGLPVLSELPGDSGRRRKNGVQAAVIEAPRSPFAIGAFRLADLFAARAYSDRARSVLFLSMAPDNNNAELVLNVAIAAAQASWRVIMVDADGSGNGLSRHLDIAPHWGLSDVLDQRCTLTSALLTDDRTNVRILPNAGAGHVRSSAIRPSPQQVNGVLLAPANEFELLFIDGGVIGQDATGYALAASVDDIVLVAGVGQTSPAQIRDALDVLGPFRDRVRGLVTS